MLQLAGISKSFFHTKVLDEVYFEVGPGEIHALVGQNGAGKSTLMKILAGMISPDEGSIFLEGRKIESHSIQDAQKLGISMLHQEPVLVPELTVAENIFLGAEPSRFGIFPRYRVMKSESKRIMKMLGFHIHPNTLVGHLLPSYKYIVAIAKALSSRSKVLIMDEPTSSLSQSESEKLFEVIRTLKTEGVSIIFITHRIQEVYKICDRITVMRDGRNMMTSRVTNVSESEVVRMMLGREHIQFYPPVLEDPGDTLLKVEGLTRRPFFNDVTFELREGEILGIAGLIGSGRSELARALHGTDKAQAGKISWRGTEMSYSNKDNVGLVYPNRMDEGLFLDLGVNRNLTVAGLRQHPRWKWITERQENDTALDAVIDLDIKILHLDQEVQSLSGGNQQKVMLGKWIVSGTELYLLDEPTRGIDIGTRGEIYAYIHNLASSGKGVVLLSSDFSELNGLCSRILVMYQGRIVKELSSADSTEEKILYYATGSQDS